MMESSGSKAWVDYYKKRESFSQTERIRNLEREVLTLHAYVNVLLDEIACMLKRMEERNASRTVNNNTKKTEVEMVNEMLSELPTEYWEDETDLSYENVCYLYNEFYGGY